MQQKLEMKRVESIEILDSIHFISDSLSETKDRNLYIKEFPDM